MNMFEKDACMLCSRIICYKMHSCFVTNTPPTSPESTERFLWAQRASDETAEGGTADKTRCANTGKEPL